MSSSILKVTPYASFNTSRNEVAKNGGAWYDYLPLIYPPTGSYHPYPNSTIIPHQTMGGVTDVISLTGMMIATVDIPSSLVQLNQFFA
jgi:hypothetical protein